MRWEDFRRSDNVEDRRGEGGGFGGGGGMPMRTGGLGIGTIVVLGLVGWALGIDPRVLIGGAEVITGGRPSAPYQQGPRPDPSRPRTQRPNDPARQFVSAILGDTEDRWTEIFQKSGRRY